MANLFLQVYIYENMVDTRIYNQNSLLVFGGLSFFLPTLFNNNTFVCNNISLTDISLFHTSPADLFHFSMKPSQVSVCYV